MKTYVTSSFLCHIIIHTTSYSTRPSALPVCHIIIPVSHHHSYDIIQHETIRVAVIDMVGDTMMHASLPPPLRQAVRNMFLIFLDSYLDKCQANLGKDGQKMNDPFHERQGSVFRWGELSQAQIYFF
eukprot:Tamp_16608.p1 GENE.Tamp_16608~~Tamp_16608.p1  ORF type:complete len:127 (-),score=20.37 Tamp_16608:326-706(-)